MAIIPQYTPQSALDVPPLDSMDASEIVEQIVAESARCDEPWVALRQGRRFVRKRITLPTVWSSLTHTHPANDDRKPAIVTVKRRRSRFGDVPDMAPEEHRRRGEAATELWREMMRRTPR